MLSLVVRSVVACVMVAGACGRLEGVAPNDASAAPDGDADVVGQPDGGCIDIAPTFMTEGMAHPSGGGMWSLTPQTTSQAGAIWAQLDQPASHLVVRFTMTTGDGSGGRSSGVAFVWSSAADKPSLPPTNTNNSLGFCGGAPDSALAAGFDTYNTTFGVLDPSTCSGAYPRPNWQKAAMPPTQDEAVEITAGNVIFSVGAKTAPVVLVTPRDELPIRWIGFTASTNLMNAASTHDVGAITVSVCR